MQLHLRSGLAWAAAVGFAIAASPISTREVKNVAIIGAGPAGASAAYHLQEYADDAGIAVNITIFEKTDHIGGRTLTVSAFDDPAVPVELGASIFVSVNYIMNAAVARYNLSLRDIEGPGPDDITAIWNGDEFVYESSRQTSWWWDATKMWWKYGMAPYSTMKLVKSTVDKFLNLYNPPHFPFRSLTQRAFELGLERVTGVTGEQFLANNKINPNFSNDIIQAATRVNYASNLAHIHGLETMVSMATDGAVAVANGNWQIFERMVRDSGGALYRNTSVMNIAFDKVTDAASGRPKYVLSTTATAAAPVSAPARVETHPIAFDNIVIANPWQYSDITAEEGVLKHSIDKVPYMKLHVTLFTSPFRLHGGFFNLPPGGKVPSTVYTTLKPGEESRQGPDGVGSTGFYSVSTLLALINPKTGKQEYLYKIFSPKAVTPDFLSSILGAEVPATFTAATSAGNDDDTSAQRVDPISWYYPHWFHSYPIELPRLTFQDPVVGDGVYYTSGMESFISCMETGALMGANVARLIVDDFAGLSAQGDDEVWEEFLTDLRQGTAENLKAQDMGEL